MAKHIQKHKQQTESLQRRLDKLYFKFKDLNKKALVKIVAEEFLRTAIQTMLSGWVPPTQ